MNITCTLKSTWFKHIEHYKFQLLVSRRTKNKIILFFSLQRHQRCSGGGTRGNAVPPLFSEGNAIPHYFAAFLAFFSAEINEQRRLQDSQVLQLLIY